MCHDLTSGDNDFDTRETVVVNQRCLICSHLCVMVPV